MKLVVVEPFEIYEKGAQISDKKTVARVRKQFPTHVVVVKE